MYYLFSESLYSPNFKHRCTSKSVHALDDGAIAARLVATNVTLGA